MDFLKLKHCALNYTLGRNYLFINFFILVTIDSSACISPVSPTRLSVTSPLFKIKWKALVLLPLSQRGHLQVLTKSCESLCYCGTADIDPTALSPKGEERRFKKRRFRFSPLLISRVLLCQSAKDANVISSRGKRMLFLSFLLIQRAKMLLTHPSSSQLHSNPRTCQEVQDTAEFH